MFALQLCCLFTFGVFESALARLGESPIQCFSRYGGKVVKESYVSDAKQVTFDSNDYVVTALFLRGKAEYLHFAKRGLLSEAEAVSHVQKVGIDVSSAKESRTHQRVGNKLIEAVGWTLPDGLAVFSPLSNSVTVCLPTFADGAGSSEYTSVAGVANLNELVEQFASSPAFTAGEVAVQEAAFASEEASRKAQEAARDSAVASQKAALTALQAQKDALNAQLRALDLQTNAKFRSDPHGSRNERQALNQSRTQLLRALGRVDREMRTLRATVH